MKTKQKRRESLADWRTIENDKEKYAAYLCSREWGVLKEAVRERSRGCCERCGTLPQDATHHLTYERKYKEDIEDLQAICTPCHEFTHGKASADPNLERRVLRYIIECADTDSKSVSVGLLFDCEDWRSSRQRNELFAIRQVFQLSALEDCNSPLTPFESIAEKMEAAIGVDFAFRLWLAYGRPKWKQHWSTFSDAEKIIARYVNCGILNYDLSEDEDGA